MRTIHAEATGLFCIILQFQLFLVNLKSKMKGFSDHVPLLNLALILPSHLNLSEGICFTEITFKISTENKKTNISVAKARDPGQILKQFPISDLY